jgi:hypothetical protein
MLLLYHCTFVCPENPWPWMFRKGSCCISNGSFRGIVGVSEVSDEIPEHKRTRIQSARTFKFVTQFTKEETKILPKTTHASKVVNPFIRALASPFTERQRDFYIPKIPSNLRNIPNVNMYMNVLYIP